MHLEMYIPCILRYIYLEIHTYYSLSRYMLCVYLKMHIVYVSRDHADRDVYTMHFEINIPWDSCIIDILEMPSSMSLTKCTCYAFWNIYTVFNVEMRITYILRIVSTHSQNEQYMHLGINIQYWISRNQINASRYFA